MSKKNINNLSAPELSAFCTQLNMILTAGIVPSVAVEAMLADATENGEKELLSAIHKELECGTPLYDALGATKRFPDYMISMIKIGEQTGTLQQVTESLARHYDQQWQISRSIKQAVTYPCVMLVLMLVVVFVLVTQVLPVFEGVYSDLGLELSPTAKAFLSIGEASKTIAIVFACIVGLILIFALVCAIIPDGKEFLKKLGTRIFGGAKLSQEIDMARFCSSASLMLSSGSNYTEAVEAGKLTLTNKAVKQRAEQCAAELEKGTSFIAALSDSKLVSGMAAGLLNAGIKSGCADKAMADVSRRYQEQADSRLADAVGRIEPAIVIILCVVVGLVLLSVMLPLTAIMSSIG